MAALKEYLYYNVNTHESAMNNLANALSDAGWAIDKTQVINSENCELYVHSNGINGQQNLYYSMRFYRQTGRNNFRIYLCANTGFNTNQTYSNQPGKWTSQTDPSFATVCGLPILVQRIYANSWFAMMYTESYITDQVSGTNYSVPRTDKKKYLINCFIGTLEMYNINYTQGNIAYQDHTYLLSNPGYICTAVFSSSWGNAITFFNGLNLLFENSTKSYNTNLGNTIDIGYFVDSSGLATFSTVTKGFKYRAAINILPNSDKSVLIKPVYIVSHSVAGYNYFFPFGECPIWVSRFYPYYYPGDLITYNNRTFRILPFLLETSSYGLAIELQTS